MKKNIKEIKGRGCMFEDLRDHLQPQGCMWPPVGNTLDDPAYSHPPAKLLFQSSIPPQQVCGGRQQTWGNTVTSRVVHATVQPALRWEVLKATETKVGRWLKVVSQRKGQEPMLSSVLLLEVSLEILWRLGLDVASCEVWVKTCKSARVPWQRNPVYTTYSTHVIQVGVSPALCTSSPPADGHHRTPQAHLQQMALTGPHKLTSSRWPSQDPTSSPPADGHHRTPQAHLQQDMRVILSEKMVPQLDCKLRVHGELLGFCHCPLLPWCNPNYSWARWIGLPKEKLMAASAASVSRENLVTLDLQCHCLAKCEGGQEPPEAHHMARFLPSLQE